MTRLFVRLLLVQVIIAFILFIQGYWYWLLNFELAFVSSVLIIMGSLSSYRRMVVRRLEDAEEIYDELMFEKLEDPYELYDDNEEKLDDEKEMSAVIKEEKQRLKQNKQTFKKTARSIPGLLSPWRILPYIFLILSFIGLNNNHVLNIPAFLVGLAAGILSAVFIGKKWIESTTR